MNRLPIRLVSRSTFTTAVAVVFVIAGAFLYLRLNIRWTPASKLRCRHKPCRSTRSVAQADNGLRQGGSTAARSDSFAQILTVRGRGVRLLPQWPPDRC